MNSTFSCALLPSVLYVKICSVYTFQNSCWTYKDQDYHNCSIFTFQAETVLRVQGKQIKLPEHMQKIYYSQHLYQYKKIHWSRFALGENRHNWWDCSRLTQFLCSMTLEVQFPWFLKQLFLDITFLYLLLKILHRPGWSQLGWSSMPKKQKDCGQGDLNQWLTTGSLRQAACGLVYPGGRLSRARAGKRILIISCTWTKHPVCILQICISHINIFFPWSTTIYSLLNFFLLWMVYRRYLLWRVLLPYLSPFFLLLRGIGKKTLYMTIPGKILLLQFLGSCNIRHWSIHKAEFTWQTGFDHSKSRQKYILYKNSTIKQVLYKRQQLLA